MNSYQLKLEELDKRVLAIEKSKIESLPDRIFDLKPSRRESNAKRILALLQKDCRRQLTDMSRELRIPVSSIYDILQTIRKRYILKLVLVGKNEGGLKNEI